MRILNTALKRRYSEYFWSLFSRIWTEYGDTEIRSISLFSVKMRENPDQKNSEYKHLSRSEIYALSDYFFFLFLQSKTYIFSL